MRVRINKGLGNAMSESIFTENKRQDGECGVYVSVCVQTVIS